MRNIVYIINGKYSNRMSNIFCTEKHITSIAIFKQNPEILKIFVLTDSTINA
jgi:hypothetical protein